MVLMGLKVVQSNELVRSAYSLSMSSKRLLLCAIAVLQRRKFLGDTTVKISATDYADAFGVKDRGGSFYDLFFKAVDGLVKAPAIRTKVNTKTDWVFWFDYATYDNATGEAVLTFTSSIIPYLIELSGFVTFKLAEVEKLRTFPSIRLFELTVQHAKLQKFELTVEQLRGLMDTGEKYPEFKEFKRCVIDVNIAKLEKHTRYGLKYRAITNGRKVVKLAFTIKTPEQRADEAARNALDAMRKAVGA